MNNSKLQVKSASDAVFQSVRSGDKVVLTVREGENVLELVSDMASRNVELEVREVKGDANKRLHDANISAAGGEPPSAYIDLCQLTRIAEDKISMDPKQAFIEFLRINTTDSSNSSSQPSGIDDAEERLNMEVLQEGLSTIDRLQGTATATALKATDGTGAYNLTLHSIDIKGFGMVNANFATCDDRKF